MRILLVSSLVFSTVLLHGQTRTNGQGVTMEAINAGSVSLPVADAAPASTDAYAGTSTRRISTGVIAPKLISNPKIVVATTDFANEDLSTQKAVISLKVNQEGSTQNVKILQSVNPTVDARVLAAVRDYHFAPATLDGEAVPMDVNLVIQFQAPKE